MTASTLDVGPNVVAIFVLVMPALMLLVQGFLAHKSTKTEKAVTALEAQLHSDDGSTARDALNRIESRIGTIPKLPPERQVGPPAEEHVADVRDIPLGK